MEGKTTDIDPSSKPSPAPSNSKSNKSTSKKEKVVWPVGEGGRKISQTFEQHNKHAIDISGTEGTEIKAATDGKVLKVYNDPSGDSNKGCGNGCIIQTNDNNQDTYCHFKDANVIEGQQVKAGDKIGSMGNTGKSSGPHLHYQRKDMNTKLLVNPMDHLKNAEGKPDYAK